MSDEEKEHMDPMLRLAQTVSQKFLDVDKRLSGIIKTNLEAVIKAGLGLKQERHHRKTEFFETNGFKGELQKLIETMANRDIQQDAAFCWTKMIGNKKFSANLKELFETHFERYYNEAFKRALADMVSSTEKQAEQEFRNECSMLGKAMDNTLAPIIAAARAKVMGEIAAKASDDETAF